MFDYDTYEEFIHDANSIASDELQERKDKLEARDCFNYLTDLLYGNLQFSAPKIEEAMEDLAVFFRTKVPNRPIEVMEDVYTGKALEAMAKENMIDMLKRIESKAEAINEIAMEA